MNAIIRLIVMFFVVCCTTKMPVFAQAPFSAIAEKPLLSADVNVDNTIQLNWNNLHQNGFCTVERSFDGKLFQPLFTTNQYMDKGTFKDEFSLLDSAFYRVLFVGLNADSAYTDIQKVTAVSKIKAGFSIMPNPVFNNASITLEDEFLGDIYCTLYDLSGKLIRTYQLRKTTVYFQQILDMYSIPKGSYILRIAGATINESKRIVKL